jgi:hypothetical protein
MANFVRLLRGKFHEYRREHFAGKDHIFQPRSDEDAVVFLSP